MQYLKLVLVFLLPLSSALLQLTRTVLPVSTHLLKKFHYSFFCSLLISSTTILVGSRCDSLHYLAVLSLLTHWHLHLLYFQSILFKSFLYFLPLIILSLCQGILFVLFSLLLTFSDFQSSSLCETTKSCRFEACIFNFQLNFSLII